MFTIEDEKRMFREFAEKIRDKAVQEGTIKGTEEGVLEYLEDVIVKGMRAGISDYEDIILRGLREGKQEGEQIYKEKLLAKLIKDGYSEKDANNLVQINN